MIVSVTWKDTQNKRQEYVYRHIKIQRAIGGGWYIDIPNDDNIYKSVDHASNAIDAALGGKARKENRRRLSKGIVIIGKRKA